MKKKRCFVGVFLCALVFIVTGCSNEDTATEGLSSGKVIVKATSSIASVGESTSRVILGGVNNVTPFWQSTDAIAINVGGETDVLNYVSGAGTQNGSFRGTINATSGTMYAYYPAAAATVPTGKDVATDLSSQSGTILDAAKNIVMFASANYSTNPNFTFSNKVSILKLNMTAPANLTPSSTLTATIEGAYSKGTLGTNGIWTSLKADNISVSGAKVEVIGGINKITGYVVVLPGSNVNSLSIYVGSATATYKYVTAPYTSTSATIVANNVVTINNAFQTDTLHVYRLADYVTPAAANNSPSLLNIKYYLSQDHYWDDGRVGTGRKSYYRPDGSVGHIGIWLKKGISTYNNIVENVKYPYATTSPLANVRTSGLYFFLPALGYYSGSQYTNMYSTGYYWSNQNATTQFYTYDLQFDSSGAWYSESPNTNRELKWIAR